MLNHLGRKLESKRKNQKIPSAHGEANLHDHLHIAMLGRSYWSEMHPGTLEQDWTAAPQTGKDQPVTFDVLLRP